MLSHIKLFTQELIGVRNRPDIRQSPVPAGYPASISGSGSGPAEQKSAGF